MILINMLLKTKKIDITKKDAFDKTFMDYIEENKHYGKEIKKFCNNIFVKTFIQSINQ